MVKVLVHCNVVNNDYQQDSKVLYTFVPNKQFGSILETSPTNSFFFFLISLTQKLQNTTTQKLKASQLP